MSALTGVGPSIPSRLQTCRRVGAGADDLGRKRRCPFRSVLGRADAAEDLFEIKGAQAGPQDQQAQDKAGVADAVGNESLVGGVGSALPLVVKTDQQVRANT